MRHSLYFIGAVMSNSTLNNHQLPLQMFVIKFDCQSQVEHLTFFKVKKVKCTLVQTLKLCTGHTAHRGSRGRALLFLTTALEGGEGSASRPGCSLPRKRPGTHSTGTWVGPRAGLDRCGKSRPHRDSIPGLSNPWSVAIPTELPGPPPFIRVSHKYTLRLMIEKK